MSPRYNIITQNPGKKISAINQEVSDLTDNLKAALDNDPTNASVSEGSGYLDLAKELKQIKDSITDLVKKTDIQESKLPSSLLPIFYTAPLAPEDYTLVPGVEINQGQLPLRDNNNKQVDGLGLAYQSGLSNDWSVEFVNAPLSNGVVSNIDNILVFDGSNNDKNNLYATKKVSNVSGYGFNATVNSSSDSNNSVPIALAISLPDNSGNITNLDIGLNVKQGESNIVLLQEANSNVVNVYAKEEGDDWYKNKNNVETTETEFTPSIINSSTTVSNIGLNTFFDGWDPIVYNSDTQWRLTETGVTAWAYSMPNEYAAAGSPRAGHVADMAFYKNSPFMFNWNRRYTMVPRNMRNSSDIRHSIEPVGLNLEPSDPNYDNRFFELGWPSVVGELTTPITPNATAGLKNADYFSVCFRRYGNDNNVKNMLKSTGSNSFEVDMVKNGRVPSLGAILSREIFGVTWTVEFTIQMKEEGIGGAHGWQTEKADIFDNSEEDGKAPNYPNTGFFFGVLTDPNDKNSRNWNSGVGKAKMINMSFKSGFMGHRPANPTRLEAPLEAATIPSVDAGTAYDSHIIRIESKPSENSAPDYEGKYPASSHPTFTRVSMWQDNKWKIIDSTGKSFITPQGWGPNSTSGGALGIELESSSFEIKNFTVTSVGYDAPSAPTDYTLVSGVEINQAQLPLRDNNNKQVDGLGLAYQSGLSNDWQVEFVNATLSNGVVSNIDNILVFDGSNNVKNNLYATKSYGINDSFGFEGVITPSVTLTDAHSPLLLTSSLPDEAGQTDDWGSNDGLGAVSAGEPIAVRLVKAAGSQDAVLYKKSAGADWTHVATSDRTMPVYPTIGFTNETVSGIRLQPDSKGLFFPIEDTTAYVTTTNNHVDTLIRPWLGSVLPAGKMAFVYIHTANGPIEPVAEKYESLVGLFKANFGSSDGLTLYASDPDMDVGYHSDFYEKTKGNFKNRPVGKVVLIADSVDKLNPVSIKSTLNQWFVTHFAGGDPTSPPEFWHGVAHFGAQFLVYSDAETQYDYEAYWSDQLAAAVDDVTKLSDTDLDGAVVVSRGEIFPAETNPQAVRVMNIAGDSLSPIYDAALNAAASVASTDASTDEPSLSLLTYDSTTDGMHKYNLAGSDGSDPMSFVNSTEVDLLPYITNSTDKVHVYRGSVKVKSSAATTLQFIAKLNGGGVDIKAVTLEANTDTVVSFELPVASVDHTFKLVLGVANTAGETLAYGDVKIDTRIQRWESNPTFKNLTFSTSDVNYKSYGATLAIENGELVVQPASNADMGAWWQFPEGDLIAIDQIPEWVGQTNVRMTFQAKTLSSTSQTLKLESQTDVQDVTLAPIKTITLTNTMQTFTQDYTIPADVTAVRFTFGYKSTTDAMILDNIVFSEQ